MQICDIEKCTGCFACRNICPKDAINIRTDEYGRTLTHIDPQKCVSCGLCQKICPENSTKALRFPTTAYAAWSKDADDVKKSSSGGAAAVFSKRIINQNGIVYGAAVNEKKVKHIGISQLGDLDLLRGSKYTQSDIGLCYRDIKRNLTDNKQVLFIGTPCQVSGLKAYLKKDYDNLIAVDLICHGVPPQSYLEEHLNKACSQRWDKFSFRGKYDWYMTAYSGEKNVYSVPRFEDTYFYSFLEGLTYRENCYQCQYARPERVSDITIGDFWGIDRKTMENQYDGRISLILTNTEKGNCFFNECKQDFVFEERPIEEAMNEEQGNLLHPTIPHPERRIFLENYKNGFDKAVYKTKLGKTVRTKHYKAVLKRFPPIGILVKIKKRLLG